MKYTYSPQKGKPGHCMVAQVWDENGDSIAIIEPTKLQKNATQIAKLFSRSHEMIEALKESKLQIEYLHEKFSETGSGNTILNKIESLIKELT